MKKLPLTSIEVVALKQIHRACKNKRAAKAIYSLSTGFSKILMLDEKRLLNDVKHYQAGTHNRPLHCSMRANSKIHSCRVYIYGKKS